MMASMSFFDERAANWDTPSRVERARGVAEVIRRDVALTPEMRVIDLGSGTGLLGLDLLADVHSVLLTDPSDGMVAMARQKIADTGIEHASAIVYDLPAGPPPGAPFDLAVSLLVLHHVKDIGGVLRSIFAMLGAGGRMAVIDLDAEDGSFHSSESAGIHHHGFERSDLIREATAAGFAEVVWRIVYEIERDGRRYPLFLLTGTKTASKPA